MSGAQKASEPPPQDSPEKGALGGTVSVIPAAAPSSGQGLGYLVPPLEPPGIPVTMGLAPVRAWGAPGDPLMVYPQRAPVTHSTSWLTPLACHFHQGTGEVASDINFSQGSLS